MLEGFFLRRPVETDYENLIALMRRCDQRDQVLINSDYSDIHTDWLQINLSRDAWVAFDADGGLRGYGAVIPMGKNKQMVIYDDPGTEHADMFLGLLTLCEGRAISQLMEDTYRTNCNLVTCIAESAMGQKTILEKWDYHILRQSFNMQRELTDDLLLPGVPPNVHIRTVIPDKDIQRIYALIQTAFDWRDRQIQPYDEWKFFMLRKDAFNPEFWFVAEASGELIGACLCIPYNHIGWIRQLAIKKEWRRQGIGRSLLLNTFQALKQRNFLKVGLSVEMENQGAFQFYERLGMTKAVHLIDYVKVIYPI